MYWIVTPRRTFHARTHVMIKRLMYLICSTKLQLKFCRLAAYTHIDWLHRKPSIHTPILKTSSRRHTNNNGKPLARVEETTSNRREFPQDAPCQQTTRGFTTAEPPPRHSCHLTTGWRSQYKTLYKDFLKEGRETVQEKNVLHNIWSNGGLKLIPECFKVTSTQYTNQRLALHWSYVRQFPLIAGWLVLEGLAFGAATLSSTSGSLWCTDVDNCSSAQFSLHALWFCPAWLRTGPPTLSGPVLPGSTLVLPRPVVLSCLVPHRSSHTPLVLSCLAPHRSWSASGPVQLLWHSRYLPLTTMSISTPMTQSIWTRDKKKKKPSAEY